MQRGRRGTEKISSKKFLCSDNYAARSKVSKQQNLTFLVAFATIRRMLKIRLQRVGRKHETIFRLVVTDSKNGPKSGKSLEVIGSYDPRGKRDFQVLETERVKHWISKGAQVSDTVRNLLIDKKIMEGRKVNALPKKRPIKKETTEAAAPTAEKAPEAPKA